MTPLTIELKKGRDRTHSLACVRADGSRTWARVHPFFPTHDLTHAAVESVLGYTEAFFGLVASGWELDAFAEPGAASRLPREALWAEHLVGLVERQVAHEAHALYEALCASLQSHALMPPPPLDQPTYEQLLRLRTTLLDRWDRLAPGDTLRVAFPIPIPAPALRPDISPR